MVQSDIIKPPTGPSVLLSVAIQLENDVTFSLIFSINWAEKETLRERDKEGLF